MTIFRRTFFPVFILMLIFLIIIVSVFFFENITYRKKIQLATTTMLQEELFESAQRHASSDIALISQALRASFIYRDTGCIDTMIRDATENVKILAGMAFSITDKVICSHINEELSLSEDKMLALAGPVRDWPDKVSLIMDSDNIVAKIPVSTSLERLGGLIIVYSTTGIVKSTDQLKQVLSSIQDKTSATFLKYISVTFLFMLLLMALTSFTLARYISTPLIALGRKISNIGTQDIKYTHKSSRDKKNELELLEQNIEKTALRLQETTVSKGYLEFLLESMDDAIVVFDESGKTTMANLPALIALGEKDMFKKLASLIYPEKGCTELFKSEVKNVKVEISMSDEHKIYLVSTSLLSESKRELLCVLKDITEQLSLADTARFNSIHDPLTGLLNRSGLRQSIDRMCQEDRQGAWLLAFDLERFNSINTGLGYLSGDRVLQTIAGRLVQATSHAQSATRTGADDFAVLIMDCDDIQCANQKALALEKLIRMPIFVEGREIWISLTVSLLPLKNSCNSGKILEEVSKSIHVNKALRRGLSVESNLDPLMETHLRQALENDELSLHFQPIVDIETGRIYALEALARWDHPERGLVTPDIFIPFAEETGLIVLVGKQIIEKAIRSQRQLVDMGILTTMHINVSARQFGHHSLIRHFKKAIEDNDITASSIMVEVTESCMIQCKKESTEEIKELKKMGMRISVDDFGSGYSSLSTLQSRPFDQLKMDKSLLPQPGKGASNSVARSVITLARELGKPIIIEGVETLEQLDSLRSIGARYIQGYLFSRSIELEDIKPLFLRQDVNEWL